MSLLSFKFREFGSVTALSVLEAANAGVKKIDADGSRGTLQCHLHCGTWIIIFSSRIDIHRAGDASDTVRSEAVRVVCKQHA